MPEFVNLNTTMATTRPEVELTTMTRRDHSETDLEEQVIVTVEAHEMVDIDESGTDTKWGRTTSIGHDVSSSYKVREVV